MNYYVNEDIKKTERIFPRQNRYNCFRYDMNENPEGLPKDFVDEVLKEVTPEFLSIYPEPDKFLNKYANFLGINYKNVLATNGSDMAIRYIFETFGERHKSVVTVTPSFEMYWVNCCILGYKHIGVKYEKDLNIKVENILNAINEDTRIVVLLNPNNPIGNVYTENDIKSIINKAKEHNAIVVIDEAYHYFYNKTFLSYAIEEENVILLRTFSKLFSLAACRLGVIISNPNIIKYIKNAKLTFDVNSIALLFGEKILDRSDIIEDLIKIEKEGKEYILKTLLNKGYECKDCTGNFIFIKPNLDVSFVVKELEKKNILVHGYNNELLKKYIRVSTGSKKSMEIFLREFFKIDNKENKE